MKALVLEAAGGIEHLRVQELPEPAIQAPNNASRNSQVIWRYKESQWLSFEESIGQLQELMAALLDEYACITFYKPTRGGRRVGIS